MVGSAAGPAGVFLYPLGAAGGVHLAAERRGIGGSFGRSVGSAALGVAVGVAASGALYLALRAATGEEPATLGDALLLITPYAVAVPLTVALRHRALPAADVAPAVLAGPAGERAPGLRLRVSL